MAESDCDAIELGAAISLTGKYSTNGVNTKDGYEFAIEKIRQTVTPEEIEATREALAKNCLPVEINV